MQMLRALTAWLTSKWAYWRPRLLIMFYAWDHNLLAFMTLGHCEPYEMISAALWSLEQDRKRVGIICRPIIDFLLAWLGPNHCEKSWKSELTLRAALKKEQAP